MLPELLLQAAKADPFFTNDGVGYVRVALAFVTGMSPIFMLVVWFLRRGPDQRITTVENDVTNLGKKVDDMGKELERDRERQITLQREIADGHREVIEMLSTASQLIRTEIHSVDVRMARIEERSDISEAFDKLAGRLENVAMRFARVG